METWVDIKGFEGYYQVSNLGRVKSLLRLVSDSIGREYYKKESILNPSIRKDGYLEIKLCVNRKIKGKLIHVLIAEVFIDNPNNYPVVRHLNDVKTDNRINNLCWGTHSDNMIDAVKNNRQVPNSILNVEQVREIKRLLAKGIKCTEISRKFPVGVANIIAIKNGKSWKHIT